MQWHNTNELPPENELLVCRLTGGNIILAAYESEAWLKYDAPRSWKLLDKDEVDKWFLIPDIEDDDGRKKHVLQWCDKYNNAICDVNGCEERQRIGHAGQRIGHAGQRIGHAGQRIGHAGQRIGQNQKMKE